MLDELLKEIQELKEFKKKYEYALKDKQKMSDKLYEYMMKEYENTPYEDRCDLHVKNMCKDCRYRDYCELNTDFPQEIWMPIPSDKAWIPGHKNCGKFEWS